MFGPTLTSANPNTGKQARGTSWCKRAWTWSASSRACRSIVVCRDSSRWNARRRIRARMQTRLDSRPGRRTSENLETPWISWGL